MASWGNWNETTNAKIDNETNSWDNKVGEVTDKWKSDVKTEMQNATNKVTSAVDKLTDKTTEAFNDTFVDKETGEIKGAMSPIDISKIYEPMQVRDKLIVECPNFMKQFGIAKIDFGAAFLSPAGEKLIATGQKITNDVLQTVGNIHKFITPEVLLSVQELLAFIIKDLTSVVMNYITNVFLTYATPEYPANLAKILAKETLIFTKAYTEDPAKIIEKLNTKTEDATKKKNDDELKKLKDIVNGEVQGKLAELQKDTQKILSDIQKYADPIAQYAQFGPDYAINQVLMIYEKQLNKCLNIVNTAKAKVDNTVNYYVKYAGKKSGQFAAGLINDAQEKSIKKAMNMTDTKKQQTKLKAVALVNKAIMNLLGQLGG